MEQGEVGPTIAHLAQELGCDQIVMGTRGHTALGDLVMGSVAVKGIAPREGTRDAGQIT